MSLFNDKVPGGLSQFTYIQAKIPDFFAVVEDLKLGDALVRSEIFSSAGCRWRMCLDPEGRGTDGKLWTALSCDDKKTGPKINLACYIGSEKADVCEELSSEFEAGEPEIRVWVFAAAFDLQELKRRKSELVPSGTLTIKFYLGGDAPDSPKAVKQRLMGLENLSSDFENLFLSKKKTDVTMKVKDKYFPVHKAVLVARSSVFSAMFEHDTSEEQTGVVKVPDCDPDSFENFLHHLYTGKFDGVTSSNAHHLYVTSDKYDVQLLKSFCVDHMMQNLTVERVLDVIVLADRYGESELMSAAQDFFNRNFSEVISTTSHWRTLMEENSALANRLLQKMAPAPDNNVIKK